MTVLRKQHSVAANEKPSFLHALVPIGRRGGFAGVCGGRFVNNYAQQSILGEPENGTEVPLCEASRSAFTRNDGTRESLGDYG